MRIINITILARTTSHLPAMTPHPSIDEVRAAPAEPCNRSPSVAGDGIDSRQLLKGRRELLIRHGTECYRLRHTRKDKLILTK